MLLIGMTAWILRYLAFAYGNMGANLGMFIGTWVSGFVTTYYSTGQVYQWRSIWFIPAYIAVAVLICFIFFFREKQ